MSAYDLTEYLNGNEYPGRGILLGRSADDRCAVIAYFIMGRSAVSRNRVFSETEDGIRTEAFDPSGMDDPSLIIYRPVRVYKGCTIVTNGDQTDTIRDSIERGRCFRHALMTRCFEPDAPHYTPRISGIVMPDGGYKLSILKTLAGDPDRCCRYFFEYDRPAAGLGHLIHTYAGDGEPLPPFEGEPRLAALPEKTALELAEALWGSLNDSNKISLFVRYIDLASGQFETVIKNKNGEGRG